METLAQRARDIAVVAHAGQVDKNGVAYITHPARIVQALAKNGINSVDAEAVAWLHDVVEDTHITLNGLSNLFPPKIIQAVDAITKRKGEKFEDYYERVKANDLALVVKWFDVADNADPKRLAKVAPDTQERLRAKYERAKESLARREAAWTLLKEYEQQFGEITRAEIEALGL